MHGRAREARRAAKRTATGLTIVCDGCGQFISVLTEAEETELRVIEFARDHAGHYRLDVDEHGIVMQAFGVKRGRKKGD